jgi:hypothetical protein
VWQDKAYSRRGLAVVALLDREVVGPDLIKLHIRDLI